MLVCNALHGWARQQGTVGCWISTRQSMWPQDCTKSYSTQTQANTSWTWFGLVASLALFTLPCKHINMHSHRITCTFQIGILLPQFNNTAQHRIKPSSKLSKCAEGLLLGIKIPFTNRKHIQMSNMKVVTCSPMQFEAYDRAILFKFLVVSVHVPPAPTL